MGSRMRGAFLVCNDWSCMVNVLVQLLNKSLSIGTWQYSTHSSQILFSCFLHHHCLSIRTICHQLSRIENVLLVL